jgi:hypothetical protein
VLVLRTIPDQATPLSQVKIYIRPEHADVVAHIDTSTRPVFSMIESQHGARIAEVRAGDQRSRDEFAHLH